VPEQSTAAIILHHPEARYFSIGESRVEQLMKAINSGAQHQRNHLHMLNFLLAQEMLVLFAILVIGYGIGQLSFRGISLGGAGVLFIALVFGHFGLSVPKSIMELGLLLFVYAVGCRAGPRFFRTFRGTVFAL